MYRNTVLYKLDAGFRYEPDTDYLSKLPATQVLPLYFDKQGVPVPISTKDFGRANNVFIKLPVDHTPFRLVSLTPKRSILVVDQYYQLLMILIILLCVVLIGVIFISFNFFRSKRLEDRLKEEKLRKELVESKNTGLEKEIISRIAVEKELKKAKEQAESANDAKSIFLANMSHELRTPLNGIIGMTELLSEAKTEQERKELIPIVLQSSYTLLTIINEILDLSKIESGKMEIEKNKFELEEALSPSLKSLAMRAQESGIQFYWYVDPEIPKCLIGDQNKLLQVIVNLVSNAIKFTHKGSVVLKIKLNKFEDRQAILTFLVKDSGIGIADDKQKIIFEAFIQADGSVSRKYGGTGLGLSISSKIVRLMGGEINLKSEPGIGSEFTFILPFGYKHINPQDTVVEKISLSTTADIRPGIKILLAEDNKINRILVIKLFDKINALIEPAENGLEAVELYRHHRYDLIFMDMQMPIMDGITATQEIRKIEQKTGRHVPIIAMTANAMKEDREACIAAGMDDFITKPVKKDIVMDIVSKFISPPEKKDV
jgi:signal transduction histidine kinase/CheY-like chemotaxis protein